LLRLLDNLAQRFGKIGEIVMRIIIGMLGLAWSILTIFVVPVLVYEGLGPIDAIKKSAQVIKHTWGESLIKSIGLGLVQFLVFALLIILSGGLTYVLSSAFQEMGLLIGIGVGMLLVFLAGLIFSVASTIFNTALYVYANHNIIASGFNEEIVKGAFRPK
jgi:hypothetical protein